MKYILFFLGLIAVLFGVVIYGWVIYNWIYPTQEFKNSSNGSIGQYIFPGVMIAFGIKWILGIIKTGKIQVDNDNQQALLVEFKYGKPDLSELIELEAKLEEIINRTNIGEYDGNEVSVDLADGTLFMYGPSADKLYEAVSSVILNSSAIRSPKFQLRYGGPEDNVKSEYK